MMPKVSILHNLDRTIKLLGAQAKQVPFASAVALTRTAGIVKEAEVREMRDVFDSPTPYTLTSVYVKAATKANLNAVVWLKDFAAKATPASAYLLPQIIGGTRRPKRFEKALQAVGALPPGYRVVPGDAAKLDGFGNIDRGQIVQILSYFKAFPEAGYKANMTDKRRQKLAKGSKAKQGFAYFVGRPGDRLPLGIWQRFKFASGSAIKPVMIFVPSTIYGKLFDFQYVANKVVDRELDRQFSIAFEQAMASARP